MVDMVILEAAAALIAVLAMIWAGARLATLSGFGRKHPIGSRTLAISEVLSLDSQRRLVLVTCGKQQVVLMTGGRQDLVVGWLDVSEATQ